MSTKLPPSQKPTRRKPWAPLAMLGLMTGLGVLTAALTKSDKQETKEQDARGSRATRTGDTRREDPQPGKRQGEATEHGA